jgi:glycosyltransferase involved in cell wall biosynthesis
MTLNTQNYRVAWVVPSVERGTYWQPILREFTQIFQQTTFFSGDVWPNFDATAPGAAVVKVVGEMKFVATKPKEGYSRGFIYLSPSIIGHLLRLRPQFIFASGFSMWTLLALIFKPLGGWRVAIFYDGSSPNVDAQDSKIRSLARRFMARLTDAFVANTHASQVYFTQALGIQENKIFTRPYLVPDANALLAGSQETVSNNLQLKRPVFLSVGRIVPRKGLQALLEACCILQSRGYRHYSLLVIGSGWQRDELIDFAKSKGLEEQVTWIEWVEYSKLGAYFSDSDVFVFPTLEDVWGMVAPEAMVFGKPVLCSKWAGAVEMVVDGQNGYVFDPNNPEELADTMQRFIDRPELIAAMGEKSKQFIASHTPTAAAEFFTKVIEQVDQTNT